jgi:hypothetical protein
LFKITAIRGIPKGKGAMSRQLYPDSAFFMEIFESVSVLHITATDSLNMHQGGKSHEGSTFFLCVYGSSIGSGSGLGTTHSLR